MERSGIPFQTSIHQYYTSPGKKRPRPEQQLDGHGPASPGSPSPSSASPAANGSPAKRQKLGDEGLRQSLSPLHPNTTPPSLSPEAIARMEENRRKALERRRQKMQQRQVHASAEPQGGDRPISPIARRIGAPVSQPTIGSFFSPPPRPAPLHSTAPARPIGSQRTSDAQFLQQQGMRPSTSGGLLSTTRDAPSTGFGAIPKASVAAPSAQPVSSSRMCPPAAQPPGRIKSEGATEDRSEAGNALSACTPSALKTEPTYTNVNAQALKKMRTTSVASEHFKSRNETRWSWLETRLDDKKRPPDHPEHNKNTLFIPERAFRALTDTRKQYWEFKSRHMDTILFFQVGSFYELYEDDCMLGVNLLGLKMTDRVNMMSCGVPLHGYDLWASKFVALGYKVARMDQVTSDKPQGGGNEPRKVTMYLTPGTLVDSVLLRGHESNYLLAIHVRKVFSRYVHADCEQENAMGDAFGVCVVDCSVAEFRTGQFEDTEHLTLLETLLIQTKPKEVIYRRGAIGKSTSSLIRRHCSAMITMLDPKSDQCWDGEETQEKLSQMIGNSRFPSALRRTLCSPLECCALANALAYLDSLNLSSELAKQKNFKRLDVWKGSTTMIIDGRSLLNLEVLENSSTGGSAHTLWELLNHCVTPFGMRLMKQWLCHPLVNPSEIIARLDAVEELMRSDDEVRDIREFLERMPDIERLASRLKARSLTLESFISLLEGVEYMWDVATAVNSDGQSKFNSSALVGLTSITVTDSAAGFPDLTPLTEEFRNALDKHESKEQGKIVLRPGYNAKYDECLYARDGVENRLEELLERENRLCGGDLKYVSNNKGRYLIEVPTTQRGKRRAVEVPSHFRVIDRLSKCCRCTTNEVEELVAELEQHEEELALISDGMLLECIESLDKYFGVIRAAAERVAEIDALISLAHASRGNGRPMCRPEIIADGPPLLNLVNMYHPFLRAAGGANDVIPNTIQLGVDGESPLMLLTGPNMGGKSTLLRQACLAVVMAQVGCFVPAESFSFTPVDRVFTRVGAHDDIFSGRSTFMVELQETTTILRYCTANSFVILDELGRGTSTFDGTAIAHAVVSHLANVGCRVMFATHYHLLVSEWALSSKVLMYHMACLVESGKQPPVVTFLYSAKRGVCPDSYGMNVARMSGMPESIVQEATLKAQEFAGNVMDVECRSELQSHVYDVLSYVRPSTGTKYFSSLFEAWQNAG